MGLHHVGVHRSMQIHVFSRWKHGIDELIVLAVPCCAYVVKNRQLILHFPERYQLVT
jgi:hypothetical protein